MVCTLPGELPGRFLLIDWSSVSECDFFSKTEKKRLRLDSLHTSCKHFVIWWTPLICGCTLLSNRYNSLFFHNINKRDKTQIQKLKKHFKDVKSDIFVSPDHFFSLTESSSLIWTFKTVSFSLFVIINQLLDGLSLQRRTQEHNPKKTRCKKWQNAVW